MFNLVATIILVTRLKKSSSQEALDEIGKEGGANHNFKRGGVRATAGPRLGWGSQRNGTSRLGHVEEPRTPFQEWTAVQVRAIFRYNSYVALLMGRSVAC